MNSKKIYEELCQTAMEDGLITDIESNLIDSIKQNIEKYYKILDQAYKDGNITSQDHFDFYSMRRKIIDDAVSFAKRDEEINPDEFKILKALQSILEEVKKDEHY